MKSISLNDTLSDCQPAFVPYVMIIESDQELANMLQYTLKHEMKIGTIFARTMRDALTITCALCPILFLIDYHLVGGNGLLLVNQLRENPLLASVPIIILTTDILNNQNNLEECTITLLPIPVEIDDLLQVIQNHLPTNSL